jgi:2-polyprenyl-3-methyl-5-hydroxy-6-metoxy-1,4-benzoquinol methylase
MLTKDISAEYRYYSHHLNPTDAQAEENVDLNEWARLLNIEELFVPGGRYGIVTEHFEGKKRAGKLLEIGCGSGVCVAWMQRFAEECCGADIYLLPHLEQPRLDSCKFFGLNANNKFPIADASYDAVVSMMVMEHVFDPFHFCREVSRILRPSGVFFLNVPLITAIGHRLTLLMGNMPVTSRQDWFERGAWDGAHLHYFTLPLLKRLLETNDFDVTLVRGVGDHHQLKSLFPSFLAKEISLRAEKRRIKH